MKVDGYAAVIFTAKEYGVMALVDLLRKIPYITKIYTNNIGDGYYTVMVNVPIKEYTKIIKKLEKSGITFEYK